jgi:hypothetical protein
MNNYNGKSIRQGRIENSSKLNNCINQTIENTNKINDNTNNALNTGNRLVNTAEGYSDLLDRMLIIQERQLRGRYQQQADDADIFDIIIGGGVMIWLFIWLPLSYLFGG